MPTWLEAFKATHPFTGSTAKWFWVVIVVGYARELSLTLSNDALVAALAIFVAFAPPWIFGAMNYRDKHAPKQQPLEESLPKSQRVVDEARLRWNAFWNQVDLLVQAANRGDADAFRELDKHLNDFRIATQSEPTVWEYAESYLSDQLGDSLRQDSAAPFSADLISLFIRHGLHEEQYLGAALARRPETRIEDLWVLADFENGYWEEDSIAEAVAETTTDAKLLSHLALNPEGSVRRAVAKNPATPGKVLVELACDAGLSATLLYTETYEEWNDAIVACGVVENPNVTRDLLQNIATGQVKIVLPNGKGAALDDGSYLEKSDLPAARAFIRNRAKARLKATVDGSTASSKASGSHNAAASLNVRHFEFVGEDVRRQTESAKFWEISQDRNSLKIRYGKIGANGQTSVKSYDSEEEAGKAANKLIAEKLKKGYIETETDS